MSEKGPELPLGQGKADEDGQKLNRPESSDAALDEALDESFPASDPIAPFSPERERPDC